MVCPICNGTGYQYSIKDGLKYRCLMCGGKGIYDISRSGNEV